MLAQAISSTRQQTVSRMRRLSRRSCLSSRQRRFPPGTTLMILLGQRLALRPDIHSAGMPLSFTSHSRKSLVRRAATPLVEAPGRSRPITRSHAWK